MQGQKGSLGSLSEAFNFEHGSTSNNAVIDQQIRWGDNSIHQVDESELQDFMISPNRTNLTFSNSIYHEQRDLNRVSLGEASSSGTKNENEQKAEHEREVVNRIDLNPLFVQPSNSNRMVRNLNLNSEFIGQGEDTNQVLSHPGTYDLNRQRSERVSPAQVFEDNGVRSGSSSVQGRRASCKRKAIDGSIGQPSSSTSGFQQGESSSWGASPAYYSLGNSLNITSSIEQGPRGLTSGFVSDFPVPVIAENPLRNSRVRINPPIQHEALNPSIFAARSIVRGPVPPTLPHPSRILPMDQNPLDLRTSSVMENVASQNQNASSAIHSAAFPRGLQPFRWIQGSNSLAGGSSNSVVSMDRTVVPREDNRSRSVSRNLLDNPLFIPPPELRNLTSNMTNRHLSGGNQTIPVNVGSAIGSNVQSNPTWGSPNLNDSQPHHQRRLNELVRRSLLSSIAADPGNQRGRTSLPPTSSEVGLLPSVGVVNTNQGNNRNHHRTASWVERQADSVVGLPHSLRVLASASRGRSRLVASEIRNVLDLMRRGENLRIEDVMLLDQSVFLGAADIHDRYRDMRLDVDNMSYEELLALEERIGDVCTGVTEEIISTRLKLRKHATNSDNSYAEPCCVCQEEYKDGDDLGTLECGHDFHSDCIKQWLKRKNICPICKTTGLNTAEKPIG